MLTERYLRPSKKEHGNTKLYWNNHYIGYIMPNKSKFSNVGENWNFVTKDDRLSNINATNRSNLIDAVKEEIARKF